jgi:hypothetical protein
MHYTSEAVQCYECNFTKKVQYIGKITLNPAVIQNTINYNNLEFKKEFWENNKDYISMTLAEVIVNRKVYINNHFYVTTDFPTKYSIFKSSEINKAKGTKLTFGSEIMYVIRFALFPACEERIYEFINDVIFENPITSLC